MDKDVSTGDEMNTTAKKYADRLIDAVCECLDRCQAADDAVECAHEFVAELRADASWRHADADRVERAVMRAVQPIDALDFKQRA
jgi:hypothetical protein